MGAKLFAWVGGLALFLGVLFFVKLSIDKGWLPPGLRVMIGFVTGLGLLAGGWQIQKRKPYAVLAHTLSATGIVVLYGVSFAAHALYQIPPFHHVMVTFGAMTLITAVAFGLAVRLNAKVIAVLGMLGGFLTPVLCSTGQDHPFGLFSYIALLDLGILAVAQRQRWLHLTPLAALGTVLMQFHWTGTFFVDSGYAYGSATWVPVMVFLGFAAMFVGAARRTREDDPDEGFGRAAALMMAGSAMLAGFMAFSQASILDRPRVLYALVLGVNALLMALVWRKPQSFRAYLIFTGLALVHLMVWTRLGLTTALLPWALGIYLFFGVGHTVFALLQSRREKELQAVPEVIGWLPVVPLGLMLLPVLWLREIGPVIWFVMLLAAGVVMALSFRTGRLLPVLGSLVLVLLTAGVWFYRMPRFTGLALEALPQFLMVTGGFAILFAGAGVWLGRRHPEDQAGRLLPVAAGVLPFGLLVMAVLRLPLPDPAPVFGLGLGLAVFLLGLARYAGQRLMATAALACVAVLVCTWQVCQGLKLNPPQALSWSLTFYALFQAYPWIFRRSFDRESLPWITASVSGLAFFLPVYALFKQHWTAVEPGLVPAAFAVLPFAGMEYVRRCHAPENPARPAQLAWLAGVGLFFITLIIPVQFERQWITLGWALEGAALCWLSRRVLHPGLHTTGAGLLLTAFVRLALNPASYTGWLPEHAPMLNWQLYAFSTVIIALLAAAAWLKPPRRRWGRHDLRPVFRTLAGILLFLLLNIEIASAFTPEGQRLSLQSAGTDFARAMTTTISWALFALGLLSLGIWKRHAPTRYGGIGLLAVALLKLFLHDLANIGSGYRIGALIVVALIALAASFLYQRFLGAEKPECAEERDDAAPPQ